MNKDNSNMVLILETATIQNGFLPHLGLDHSLHWCSGPETA